MIYGSQSFAGEVSGVLLIAIGFIGMVGCAWPHIVDWWESKRTGTKKLVKGATRALWVMLALSAISLVFTFYYEGRKIKQIIVEVGNSSATQDNATGTKQNEQPSARIPHANDASTVPHKKKIPLALQPLPTQRVDWHDKQNWRKYLHTGMSRSEVRELFGEPRNMSVEGDMEFWGYEDFDAEIVFQMDSHKDGSLFSWEEPK